MTSSRAIVLFLGVAWAVAASAEFRLDARALMERSVTRGVRLEGGVIVPELGRTVVEDDGPAAGYSYKPNEERLSAGVRVKKELIVPGAPGRATLLVGGAGTFDFAINGRPAELKVRDRSEGKWQAYDLPPGLLRVGKNEIVIGGTGSVWIAREDEYAAGSVERPHHPNRSARSADDGKTWDYDHLGKDGTVDGEYCVRLSVDHARGAGSLTLPVVDLGNLDGQPVADAVASIGRFLIMVPRQHRPGDHEVTRVRFGATPAPDGDWSRWRELGNMEVVRDVPARYAQIRIDVSGGGVEGVRIIAEPKRASAWARGVKLVSSRNDAIVRSATPFAYEPFDHPRLKELRERYKLDEVVRGAGSEFELITRLAEWSAGRWSKGHLGQAYPAWDALEILKAHADGTPVGGFCQQYNLVFLQACESFGIPGRAVSIGPGGLIDRPRRGGHEVVELWSNEHRKWVYVDGQFAWYAVDEKGGVPLSLLELRERQLAVLGGRPSDAVRIVKVGDVAARAKEDWNALDKGLPFGELRMIPRSNFLQQVAPLPLNQGMRGWSWTGHFVWTDDALPAAEIYGHRVSRRGDWEPTLNGVHCTLEATATPGEVRVHLETQTPGFAGFFVSVDGAAGRSVESGFTWALRKGRNKLEVWPTNLVGRKGIVSHVVLDYE